MFWLCIDVHLTLSPAAICHCHDLMLNNYISGIRFQSFVYVDANKAILLLKIMHVDNQGTN